MDSAYLSYSGWKKHETCGFAYWNEYVNRTKTDTVDDRLGSVFGSVTGRLFEEFYVGKMWRSPQPQADLMAKVDPIIAEVLKKETSPWKDRPGGVLLWKGEGPGQNPKAMYTDVKELAADVRDAVARGIRIIRQYRLVGPRADAEYKLDYRTPEGIMLAGRADFIVQRVKPYDDLVIVDGKGSRHRGKYVDPKQLQWYAMLFRRHALKSGAAKQLPDKLAFLFWRSDPDESMDWLDISEEEADELYEHAVETVKDIKAKEKRLLPVATVDRARGVFTPKANEQNCRFCPYASVCPPGAKVQERMREKYK